LRNLSLNLLIVIALGTSLSLNAQTLPVNASSECLTEAEPGYTGWRTGAANIQNMVSTLKHDTCLNKKFSIVFYIVADSLGTWGTLTQVDLDTCMNRLNRAFSRICVSFMNCSTVVIPNYKFDEWDKISTEPLVVSNWYTENTINVYLPASITGSPVGYAYMPPSAKDVIVVEKSAVASLTPIHEMGHFFGLIHTHEEIGAPVSPGPPSGVLTYEYFARTNCYTNGDGFCDTEADCYPQPSGTKDGNNEYYLRPIDNYMSYHGSTRCRFTQEQYNFMAGVILTSRLYLH
jgi:hypothetical protein